MGEDPGNHGNILSTEEPEVRVLNGSMEASGALEMVSCSGGKA